MQGEIAGSIAVFFHIVDIKGLAEHLRNGRFGDGRVGDFPDRTFFNFPARRLNNLPFRRCSLTADSG